MKTAIVISASSDIGTALCKNWAEQGWRILGTFRTLSESVKELEEKHKVEMLKCDLLDLDSIEQATEKIIQRCPNWDVIVFAPGLMEPIGSFENIDFEAWERAMYVNTLRPLRVLRKLLPFRNKADSPSVIFFAGAGASKTVLNYSAYATSKIALIKMCELLDAEISDTRFAILGPGWVKTKIHQSTLTAGEKGAGSNFQRTLDQLQSDQWISVEKIIECCNWVISSSIKAVGGRNFSVAFDKWGAEALIDALEADNDMYKLRRHQNSWTS